MVVVSFSTGLLFVSTISLAKVENRVAFLEIFRGVKAKQMKPWTFTASALSASFVAMQTYVMPIAGLALFTVASLVGQTTISLLVDRFGLTGREKSAITKSKVLASVITVVEVLVSSLYRFTMSNF